MGSRSWKSVVALQVVLLAGAVLLVLPSGASAQPNLERPPYLQIATTTSMVVR
jgi:hypothetical protein